MPYVLRTQLFTAPRTLVACCSNKRICSVHTASLLRRNALCVHRF